jgi:hypothetical protein
VGLSNKRARCGILGLLCVGVPGVAGAAPSLTISPHLNLLYDSNIARSSPELAAQRRLHQSDFRASPGLTIDLEKPFGNQSIFLNGDVGYDFYARNHRLNSARVLLDGGVNYRVSRCSGAVTGNLRIRQSQLEEFLDAGPVKNIEYFRKVGVGVRCGGAIGLAPFANVGRSWASNSNSLRDFADYTMNEASGGIAYTRPTFGELSVVASVRKAEYTHREGLDLSNGYKVFSIGGRYSRDIGSRLKGSFGVFRTTVDPGSGFQEFTGVTTDASLDALLGGNLQAHLSWTRDISPVTLGFGSFEVDNRLDLSGTYALSPRLSLGAGGGLVRRHVEGDSNLSLTQIDRERRWFAFSTLTYHRSARTAIDLQFRHEQRRADPSIFNYNSTSVGLNFRLSF